MIIIAQDKQLFFFQIGFMMFVDDGQFLSGGAPPRSGPRF